MKVAQKMHNPWSLQEKRGYTQRIITALCFLALGNIYFSMHGINFGYGCLHNV